MERTEVFAYSVVMTGYAGQEETQELINEKKQALEERFSSQWLDFGIGQEVAAALSEEEQKRFGVTAVCKAGEGGIFTALWELGVMLDSGLTIDLDSILIKQVTIEVGEYLDKSPYYFDSGNCCLYVTKQGYHMAEMLKQKGIPAAVIGSLSDTRDRIIKNGEKTQFLTPLKRSISTGMMM